MVSGYPHLPFVKFKHVADPGCGYHDGSELGSLGLDVDKANAIGSSIREFRSSTVHDYYQLSKLVNSIS